MTGGRWPDRCENGVMSRIDIDLSWTAEADLGVMLEELQLVQSKIAELRAADFLARDDASLLVDVELLGIALQNELRWRGQLMVGCAVYDMIRGEG